jgi:hypothetical protein
MYLSSNCSVDFKHTRLSLLHLFVYINGVHDYMYLSTNDTRDVHDLMYSKTNGSNDNMYLIINGSLNYMYLSNNGSHDDISIFLQVLT